mgnify:CR=1 FL=1
MNISEFRQYARKWGKGKDPIKLLFPLDRLELLPANKKRKTHAVDHRSFMDSDGYWNIYPIAIDSFMFISFALIAKKSTFTETTKVIMKAPDVPIVSHKLKTTEF